MRVLIADDDLVSRMLLSEIVTGLGHECRIVADGSEAWELYQEWLPEVVVTDWMMPGLDGIELARRVRAAPTGGYTYVLVATSKSDRDHVLEGMEAGADDYLIKPIDAFELETRLIAALRVTSLHAELARYRDELTRMASVDPLTGLRNRQSLDDNLATLHASSVRHGRRYALAMCDVDYFKAYNDSQGHLAGDEVLRTLGAAFRLVGRQSDTVYRYGGEEFLLLLPEEHLEGALVGVERFRRTVSDLALPHPASPTGIITLSIGVAGFDPQDQATSREVLGAADAALYRAKASGRNRVVSWCPITS